MNRDEYLKMCQKSAILPKEIGHIIKDIPTELIVEYDGIQYYPYAYKLSFDKNGKPEHTAILHSLVANAITNAKLERVKEYGKERNI